jgi:hypothetical protein
MMRAEAKELIKERTAKAFKTIMVAELDVWIKPGRIIKKSERQYTQRGYRRACKEPTSRWPRCGSYIGYWYARRELRQPSRTAYDDCCKVVITIIGDILDRI